MKKFLALAALVTAIGNAQAAGPINSFKVGNWSGGAYTNDRTRVFSHCAASTPYLNGILFLVGVTSELEWTLGFLHPQWQLQEGETIPVQFVFDERKTITLNARAISRTTVVVPMPNTSELVSVFRRSHFLKAIARGNTFTFRLDGTSRLLPVLVDCVRRQTQPTPVATTPQIPSSLPTANPTATGSGASELEIEALRLATNFVLQARLPNTRMLDRREFPTQLASYGAAWQSDGTSGAVKIIQTAASVKGIDVAAEVVAADARECKGKFASGRTSELVDSDVVFRGFSSCDDSAGLRVSQYLVVPRRKGGFVMFSLAASAKPGGMEPGLQKEEFLATFRRAALTSANE
jgi:hypothetical protein